MTKQKYTLVRHSAWVVNRDASFERAVESRSITDRQAEMVRKAGGLVFTDYTNAEDAGEAEMYPSGHEGLIGRVGGTFGPLEFDGVEIYLPDRAGHHSNRTRGVQRESDVLSKHLDRICEDAGLGVMRGVFDVIEDREEVPAGELMRLTADDVQAFYFDLVGPAVDRVQSIIQGRL